MDYREFEPRNIFGLGKENTAFAQYFTGTSYLNPLTPPGSVPPFANVTFEPGCRNNWHTHRAKQDAEGAFGRPFCMYCYIAARKQGKIIMADGRISGAEGGYQMKIIFKVPQTIDFPPRFCYTL